MLHARLCIAVVAAMFACASVAYGQSSVTTSPVVSDPSGADTPNASQNARVSGAPGGTFPDMQSPAFVPQPVTPYRSWPPAYPAQQGYQSVIPDYLQAQPLYQGPSSVLPPQGQQGASVRGAHSAAPSASPGTTQSCADPLSALPCLVGEGG